MHVVRGRGDRHSVPISDALHDAAPLFCLTGTLLRQASVAQDAGDAAAMLSALSALHEALGVFLLGH